MFTDSTHRADIQELFCHTCPNPKANHRFQVTNGTVRVELVDGDHSEIVQGNGAETTAKLIMKQIQP